MKFPVFLVTFTLGAVGAAQAAEQKDAPAAEKKICRSEMQTGTRFPTRICHTKAEWDELAEKGRRDASEIINRPMINRGGEGMTQ